MTRSLGGFWCCRSKELLMWRNFPEPIPGRNHYATITSVKGRETFFPMPDEVVVFWSNPAKHGPHYSPFLRLKLLSQIHISRVLRWFTWRHRVGFLCVSQPIGLELHNRSDPVYCMRFTSHVSWHRCWYRLAWSRSSWQKVFMASLFWCKFGQ